MVLDDNILVTTINGFERVLVITDEFRIVEKNYREKEEYMVAKDLNGEEHLIQFDYASYDANKGKTEYFYKSKNGQLKSVLDYDDVINYWGFKKGDIVNKQDLKHLESLINEYVGGYVM